MIIVNGKIGVERKRKITFSTCREKSAYSLTISLDLNKLGLAPNCKPTGALTVNKDVVWGVLALYSNPKANLILEAVVTKKDPPISKRAFFPNTIPLGLIRNRLAVLLALINSSMLEINHSLIQWHQIRVTSLICVFIVV